MLSALLLQVLSRVVLAAGICNMTPNAKRSRGSSQVKLARALLLIVGVPGLGIWILLCALYLILSSHGVRFESPSRDIFLFLLLIGPLATFSSYILIAWRRFRQLGTLMIWGLIAHLPFLVILHYDPLDDFNVFKIAVALFIAMLVYPYYVWSVWKQATRVVQGHNT